MAKQKKLKRYIAYNARLEDSEFTSIVEPALDAGYTKKDLIIEGAKSFMEVGHKSRLKQD